LVVFYIQNQKEGKRLTEKELNQYMGLKKRMENNEKKLIELKSKEITILPSKVKGSSRHFPYTETHTKVEVYEPTELESNLSKIRTIERNIETDKRRVEKTI